MPNSKARVPGSQTNSWTTARVMRSATPLDDLREGVKDVDEERQLESHADDQRGKTPANYLR
eukprot:2771567-Alexandrium_andersonii.AAC.1